MTLIKSISGIRGTIGGRPGEGLTPVDIVKFTAAFGRLVQQNTGINKVVIGRDARISGDMVRNLVVGTLQSIGIDVIDLGLSTTPTVEIAVPAEQAGGGIILTASHNPAEWNALKLINEKGEHDRNYKTLIYIRKDHLNKYLKSNNFKIICKILLEKRNALTSNFYHFDSEQSEYTRHHYLVDLNLNKSSN